jgi:hypothetical protein
MLALHHHELHSNVPQHYEQDAANRPTPVEEEVVIVDRRPINDQESWTYYTRGAFLGKVEILLANRSY